MKLTKTFFAAFQVALLPLSLGLASCSRLSEEATNLNAEEASAASVLTENDDDLPESDEEHGDDDQTSLMGNTLFVTTMNGAQQLVLSTPALDAWAQDASPPELVAIPAEVAFARRAVDMSRVPSGIRARASIGQTFELLGSDPAGIRTRCVVRVTGHQLSARVSDMWNSARWTGDVDGSETEPTLSKPEIATAIWELAPSSHSLTATVEIVSGSCLGARYGYSGNSRSLVPVIRDRPFR
jgi:hypothetical protein